MAVVLFGPPLPPVRQPSTFVTVLRASQPVLWRLAFSVL
jgi:hypothetical protein